jgi:hypothetical protein
MKVLALLSFLLISSCGALLDSVHDDPKFHSIRDQFVKDAKLFGINVDTKNIRIAFGDIHKKIKYAGFISVGRDPGDALAYCLILQKSNNDLVKPLTKIALGDRYKLKIILVSQDLKDQPADYLESIVYHELGHCALNQDHNNRDSIMNPYGIYHMDMYRYFYLKDLFTQRPVEQPDLLSFTRLEDSLELIYKVDYQAFNQRIFHQLFYDHNLKEYIFSNTPELL